MAWNAFYYEIIDQIYWQPRYIGMKSINQKHWARKDGMLSVPLDKVNTSGPLYTRSLSLDALRPYLDRQEEILNQVFNLTFAIAPDYVLRSVFHEPLRISAAGPYKPLGQDVASRYGWRRFANITKHDWFFTSDTSAVGVELKLRSTSWPAQLAKYIALMVWEQIHSGERDELGLLFIIPHDSLASHWPKCGLDGPHVNAAFLDEEWSRALPLEIRNLFSAHRELVSRTIGKLRLEAISWTQFRDTIARLQSELDPEKGTDQTLYRLLEGLLHQLQNHQGTGIPTTSHDTPAAHSLSD